MILKHVSIRTSDMERSIAFYETHIGLELIRRKEIPQNNAEIAFLIDPAKEGMALEITRYRDQEELVQAEYEERLFDHLAFETDNLEARIAGMREDGIIITDEPFRLGPDGPLLAFIEDPDGTLIELIERPM